MRNLKKSDTYKYSFEELTHLRGLRVKYGDDYDKLYGKSKKRIWYDGEKSSKSIKNAIFKKIFFGSRLRCGYCSKFLNKVEKEIDHFIPNSDRPQLSFHPYNLIPSCSHCNKKLKSQHNPEIEYSPRYTISRFYLVHPYLNNVEEHIVYLNDGYNFDFDKCSIEGLNTIELFELHREPSQIDRINQLTLDKLHPISDDSIQRLVDNSASYKT